jgi:glycosyltransferase involved in cell wall biosynthesis
VTVLNVILDDVLSPSPTGRSRYAEELTRALIEYAPSGCSVEGIVAASPESDYQSLSARLPGMSGLFKSALTHRDLTSAWQHGFTPVPAGMIHAPSLLAPMRKHDRVNTRGSQIAVTIHDVTAWTHPELLTSRQASWVKAMAQRAFKYADAVVVPTHALAAELDSILPFGDRIRVLGGAVSASLAEPADADARAKELDLPERYLLTLGNSSDASGIRELLSALGRADAVDLPLLVAGAEHEEGGLARAVAEAGLPEGRVRVLGALTDPDLGVALARAEIFLYPTMVPGFGLPLLEAFWFGTPVIHSDSPALLEIAGDAGLAVAGSDRSLYPGLLADAIERVLGDDALRSRLSILGADRAKLFTWRASAEGVWQLHADL